MSDLGRGIDYSIQLVPVPALAKRPKRRLAWGLLVAFAVMLSLGAIVAVVLRVTSTVQSRGEVRVAAQRPPAIERAEAIAVFDKFDAVEERRAQQAGTAPPWRESVAALFQKLQTCSEAKDLAGFQALVDLDRLLERVDRTGALAGWETLDKRFLRSEFHDSIDLSPFWNQITIAGVVIPDEDVTSRIVYAHCHCQEIDETTGYRFWIARAGESEWKLYDWERLELGVSESHRWAAYSRHRQTPGMAAFVRCAELLAEARTRLDAGDEKAAKESLHAAEAQVVPAEMADYCLLLLAYRWSSLNEFGEAERCCKKLREPKDAPGGYSCLLHIKQLTNPAEALKYAELYQAALGASPGILEARAQILERLHRNSEAAEVWKKVLRIQPENLPALTQFYLALPKERSSEIEELLARVEEPKKAAVSVARRVGYRDYPKLVSLVSYLERQAPETPDAFYVAGYAHNVNGRYDEAAKLFRRAFEAESDEERRDAYVQGYVETMAANGQVIEALTALPDLKKALVALLHQNDDEGQLNDDDYRAVVALYAERYPEDVDALQRMASLAYRDKRYDEAERLLRKTLEHAKSEGGKSDHAATKEKDKKAPDKETAPGEKTAEEENVEETVSYSLATVLAKQGRLKEAYDVPGDRKKRFLVLARQAVRDKRWADARSLIDLERANDPLAPGINYLQAELAAHDNRWDDAIGEFQKAIKSTPADEQQYLKFRLAEVCLESGRWGKYYYAEDPQVAFKTLAQMCVDDDQWPLLTALVTEYRNNAQGDIALSRYEAEAAWKLKDYARHARLAAEVLRSDDNKLSGYERSQLEHRRLSSLLRANEFGQALEIAQDKLQKENDPTFSAIVAAALGNTTDAMRSAREAATHSQDATVFYANEDVGELFLSEPYRELQREFPVMLPITSARSLAVVVSDQPWRMSVSEIEAAVQQLGLAPSGSPRVLSTTKKKIAGAYAIPFENGCVTLVLGSGHYDEGWLLDNNQESAPILNNAKTWLAVGVASRTAAGREQVEALARRIASRLVGERPVALCTRAEVYSPFNAYPPGPDLLAKWQTSWNVKSFKEQGIALESKGLDLNSASQRDFDRLLREAAIRFEAAPSKFVVWGSVSSDPAVDIVALEVTKIERSYGGFEFEGTLQDQSALVPHLRPGLPMRFQQYRIQAYRWDNEAPVCRP